MKPYILILCILFSSCSALKTQEQKRLQAAKEIAKDFFEIQYEISIKTNSPRGGDFIYTKLIRNRSLTHLLDYPKDLKNIIRDSTIYTTFFNTEALVYYKSQFKEIDLSPIEDYIVSDKIKLKPKIDEGREMLRGYVYIMGFPVFTKDHKYAIFYYGVESNYSGIAIYKKENGKWKSYRGFMIGFIG